MADNPNRGQRFRVGGSGYTFFTFNGGRIKFARTIQDQQPRGVADPVAVQPLDERHPVEIAFPAAVGPGRLIVTVIEEWDRDVWRQFAGYRNRNIDDLADLFDRSAQLGGVTCVKVINPPRGRKRRVVQYHGAVITDIDMGENVAIETMTIDRPITITYTHVTRRGG